MRELNRIAVEADGRSQPAAGCTVGAHQCLAILARVAGHAADDERTRTDGAVETGDKAAAVDPESVGQYEDSGKVRRGKDVADGFAGGPRPR
jgi:hypothetical protein